VPTRPIRDPFALDLLRASLGPALVAPYERAFGPVPWLTAGTLSFPGSADADHVLAVWAAWAAWAAEIPVSALTAVRVGRCELAIDVAIKGDPCGVPGMLAPLRALAPGADTVATVGPRALRAPAALESAAVALPAFPHADELLDAPDGVCLGLRHARGARGPALIGLAPGGERVRAVAAIDQVARALEEPVSAEGAARPSGLS
jgi:hypothetical protein